MSPIPRRKVQEIVALHNLLHDKVKEVYVEGEADKTFFKAFLKIFGFDDVAVLPIDTVEIPTSEVERLRLRDGNKGRVITLAAMLEGLVSQSEVVCIADADTDYIHGVKHNYVLLLVTDYTSVEAYLLCPSALEKFLVMCAPHLKRSASEVVSDLAKLLEGSFLIRAAAEEMGLDIVFPEEHAKFCKIKNGKLLFRRDDYIKSCFRFSLHKQEIQQLKLRVAQLDTCKPIDPRRVMHGHDLVDTFVWYLRENGQRFPNPETFKSLVLGLIDFKAISGEYLFAEILSRLRSSGPQLSLPQPGA